MKLHTLLQNIACLRETKRGTSELCHHVLPHSTIHKDAKINVTVKQLVHFSLKLNHYVYYYDNYPVCIEYGTRFLWFSSEDYRTVINHLITVSVPLSRTNLDFYEI